MNEPDDVIAPPQWVIDEINLRITEGMKAYDCLPESVREMRTQEEYVNLFVRTNYHPLTWSTTGIDDAK